MPTRLPSAVLLLLAVAACHPSFRRAVTRAETAEAAGDLHAAAHAWREACRIAPGDDEACARAEATSRRFAAEATAAAAPACAAGDPERCVARLRSAAELTPEDPEVLRLLEEAGRLHAARCPPGGAAIDDALDRIACLEAWREALPAPAFRERLEGERRALATTLAARASEPAIEGNPAALQAVRVAAACLDPAHRAAGARADERLGAAAVVPLAIDLREEPGGVRGPDPVALCGIVEAAVPLLRCGGTGAPLVLQIDLALGAVEYAREENVRTARVHLGTRHLPNPAYAAAEAHVRTTEAMVEQAEEEERRASDRCAAYRRSHDDPFGGPCRWASDAADERRRLESEASAARFERMRTPETITEELHRLVPYREAVHRWSAPFAATVAGPAGRVAVAPPGGRLVHEDLERVGVPDAGIVADPFEDLPAGRFEALASDSLEAPLIDAARAALRARGDARAAACASAARWSAPWLACHAEAAAWRGRRVEEALLAVEGAPIPCR